MKLFRTRVLLGSGLLMLIPVVGLQAQTATNTGTGTLTVSVNQESYVSSTNANLNTTGNSFAAPFTGTSTLTYKVRTLLAGGSGSITARVTTDFSTGAGPSVATPPTAGDTLTYTPTVTGVGAAATTQTASTTASTPVVSFGTDAHTAFAGDSVALSWTLVNDPKYATGSYVATVTYTIAST